MGLALALFAASTPALAANTLTDALKRPPSTRTSTGTVIQPAQPLDDAIQPIAVTVQEDPTDVLRSLRPARQPDPLLIRLATGKTLVEIVSYYSTYNNPARITLQVGERVSDSVSLLPLPPKVKARQAAGADYSVVVLSNAIALVESGTRTVAVLVDKTTHVAVTVDPEYSLYVDMTGGRVIIASVVARLSEEVYFELGRADLTDEARGQLRLWRDVLQNPEFDDAQFLVVGHTDRSGKRSTNMALSLKRAKTVATYLGRAAPFVRFYTRGAGPDELKYPDEPFSPGNRRVEIIRVYTY